MTAPTPFRAIERTNASDAVREQLVGLIESGQLRVGQRLPSEKELARTLGVSRPVVREALGSLKALGLIVSRSGSGSFVAAQRTAQPLLLGRYSADELLEVRSALEVQGAAMAASRRTVEDLQQLEEIIEQLERSVDPHEWVRLDAAFHLELAQATRNQLQARLVENLRELLVVQSETAARIAGRIGEANLEHRAIVLAIKAGDEQAAEEAMTQHLLSSRRIWDVVPDAEPTGTR